ncbi:MAG: biotin--[acetyl-CoA-carboxylase] ligase [Campylobacterota bacterium]|nr:biotin--[acetyl-CoA-carboxylase] ligase [Campylobacterota bacterium]
MQILFLDRIDSTQLHLKELLQSKKVLSPYAVVADIQTAGIGSRDNSWTGLSENLFLSFSFPLTTLPKDLKLESSSIYFSYILKETLQSLNSDVWLKWPNDFYMQDKKIGGMITNIVGNSIVCGVGLNLKNAPDGFGVLDIDIDKKELLNNYFANLEKKVLWKQVFSNYKLEFHLNQNFITHIKNKKVHLGEATLEADGSLNINGQRIYSLR